MTLTPSIALLLGGIVLGFGLGFGWTIGSTTASFVISMGAGVSSALAKK